MTTLQEKSREEMAGLYDELTRLRERLAQLKRETAKGDVIDYELTDGAGNTVKLSQLFGDQDDLIVVQNMGKSCPYCTLWADGFVGLAEHLSDRAAFVLVSPDSFDVAKDFADTRGWNFTVLSSAGSDFKRDLGFENEQGEFMPGVSTFRRDGGAIIRNVANDMFGPGDSYCAAWHFFDLLQDGSNDWSPKYSY